MARSSRKWQMRYVVALKSTAVAVAVALILPSVADALTIREAVQRAIATHPELGAIRANRLAIEQELRQARGQYLPSIDVRSAVGHEFSNNPSTRLRAGRTNGEGGWVDMNRFEAGVSLRQLVYNGLGTVYDIKRQLGRAESAQYRVADTAQAIALRAVEAFLEVQRTRRIVAIADRNVRIHVQILSRVRARAASGRGPRSDVDQALARVAAQKAALAQARGRFEDAVAAYIQAIGEKPPADLASVTAPERDLPSNIDEAVAMSREKAPSIMAAAADIRSAAAAVGVADSRFMPTVTVEASYNWLYNVDGVRGPNQEFIALVVGRWNLYRGGIDLARRREAVQRMFQARNNLGRTQREVAQQVRQSWNALNAARERLVAIRQQLAANSRVRVAYSRQFDRGRRTLLDLLDIQNEIFSSETALVTEEFTIKFGVYRVFATIGILVQKMGLKLPVEAVPARRREAFLGTSRTTRGASAGMRVASSARTRGGPARALRRRKRQ